MKSATKEPEESDDAFLARVASEFALCREIASTQDRHEELWRNHQAELAQQADQRQDDESELNQEKAWAVGRSLFLEVAESRRLMVHEMEVAHRSMVLAKRAAKERIVRDLRAKKAAAEQEIARAMKAASKGGPEPVEENKGVGEKDSRHLARERMIAEMRKRHADRTAGSREERYMRAMQAAGYCGSGNWQQKEQGGTTVSGMLGRKLPDSEIEADFAVILGKKKTSTQDGEKKGEDEHVDEKKKTM